MASLIDVSALTLNEEEATAVSEVVFERVFENPALSASHAIFTGIERDRQIPFAGLMGRMGEKVTDCSLPAGTGFAMTQKKWTPVDWGFRLSHCHRDLDPLLKLFRSRAPRHSADDIQGSDVMDFIVNRVEDAMIQNIIRMVWFGDTAMDTVANAGYLANALDGEQAVWQAFNGLWVQIIADANIPTVTISENAEATEADQLAIGAGNAVAYFKEMHEKADSRLLSDPSIRYYCSRTIAQEYLSWLEDKSLAFTLDRAEDGTPNLSYRGIPIEVRDDWDRTVQLFDDGTVLDKPNRILLTTPSNIPIGTMDTESLEEIKSFYDQKDRTNYMDIVARLDVKFLESYMAVKAY